MEPGERENETRFFPSGRDFLFCGFDSVLRCALAGCLLDHGRAGMNKLSATQLEKRIIWVALAFAAVLLALSALAINLFHVGLPTCLTDVKPFQKGELIAHSPTHYELHYVARMWKFEPEDVTIPAGSTVDIYLERSRRDTRSDLAGN